MSGAGRRAIVEICAGPLALRKGILSSGETLSVGHSSRAGLVIAHDRQMSAEHFSVSWDGERCLVRDLQSAGGTLVSGLAVREGEVRNGGWIRAGGTDFRVFFEAWSRPDPALIRAHVDAKVAALHQLSRAPGLYAIIDASRGLRPITLLREAVDERQSLYEGIKGDALADVAPHLLRFRPDSGLLERLVSEGWGARWGVFLTSPRPFREVRRHLRRFLVVMDEVTNQKVYFRFYDPRALRVFLPVATPRQRADLFAEIASFLVEGEELELLRFHPSPVEDAHAHA